MCVYDVPNNASTRKSTSESPEKIFADVVKVMNLEMEMLFWIVRVGPMYVHETLKVERKEEISNKYISRRDKLGLPCWL